MPLCLLVPHLAQLLQFWPHPSSSTAKQIKNVAGHQAKCIVVLGLVLKSDRHGETKG